MGDRGSKRPSTCSLPDKQYLHVIYGGRTHYTRMLGYYLVSYLECKSTE